MRATLIIVLSLAGLVGISQEVNLFNTDPGFEKGKAYWRFQPDEGYASFLPGKGIGGSTAACFRSMDALPTPKVWIYHKGFIPVTGGKSYTFSASFRSELKEGYAAINMNFWRKCKGCSQTVDSNMCGSAASFRVSTSTGGKWESLRYTFTVPEDVNGLHPGLMAEALHGEVCFDDLVLYEGDGSLALPLLEKAPPLLGKLDVSFARRALHLTDFMLFPVHASDRSQERTEAYLGMTRTEFLLTALLYSNSPRAKPDPAPARDGNLWCDDGIELFLTYANTDSPLFHFVVNRTGGMYDSQDDVKAWNSAFKAVANTDDPNCCIIQLSIPLKDIGYDAAIDDQLDTVKWRFNLGRFSFASKDADQLISTWGRVDSFRDVKNFMTLSGLHAAPGRTVSSRFWHGSSRSGAVKTQRHWKVADPLYDELISRTPNPLAGESCYIWPRPIEQCNVMFALQYGQEYTRNTILAEYAKYRLHPYGHCASFDSIVPWLRSSGVGICLYSPYFAEGFTAPYNPSARRRMMKSIEEQFTRYPGLIWAVSLGDEPFSLFSSNILKKINDPALLAADKPLQEAVTLIKNKYGYGKYGPPTLSGADQKFNYLAFRNWLLAEMIEMQAELQAICARHKGPGGKPVVCIGPDPTQGNLLQHLSRFAPYQDIATAQMVPPNNPLRQALGFRTKLIKDLTGKAVWLCAHVEPYGGYYTTEETAAFMSEVARGGGTGVQIWNYDLIGQDYRKMNCTQFDYYGHRARWDTMCDCIRRFQNMNLLKFPKPSFAVFVSNDTSLSGNMYVNEYEAAFNLFGPGVRSWFKFVSDLQLLDGKAKLSDWPLVIIPKADIQNTALHSHFQNYLAQGGKLICFDPDVFGKGADGADTSAFREKLFCVRSVLSASRTGVLAFKSSPLFAGCDSSRMAISASNVLQPTASAVRTLATLEGKPVVTLMPYPKGGAAIFCAFKLNGTMAGRKDFLTMARNIVKLAGGSCGEDIWRFTFPCKPDVRPVFELTCLTGNNFYWWNNEPVPAANATMPNAMYTLSPAPDGSPSSVHSFEEGNLTNRRKATSTGDIANIRGNRDDKRGLHLGIFADTWREPKPFVIDFDFARQVKVRSLRIFFQGTLPDFEVVADDGRPFAAAGATTDEVVCREVTLPAPKNTRHLRLRMKERPADAKLILSEIEVWGNLLSQRAAK